MENYKKIECQLKHQFMIYIKLQPKQDNINQLFI